MVKLRDARYCNLKLLLVFLVIYGHCIEPGIGQSRVLMTQYKWIYLFHMPLFSFLSGLFLNDRKSTGRQCLKMISLYLLLQTVTVLFGNGKVKPLTPYWHLWYLLSYSTWAGLGLLWFRFCKGKGKLPILACSIAVGCLVGLSPDVGREHSLSRTLVFLPYFWMGLICDPHFPWERMRLPAIFALGIALAVMACYSDRISAEFLYQAAPYGSQKDGVALRLICYLIGICLSIFLLAFIPTRRFPVTRAGADTMPAYLIHAPVVLWIRKMDIPWSCHILITMAILYTVHQLLRWNSALFGIVPTERRGSGCLPFKKSTKNMPRRSIGSYSL